jgi:hypothetical protein
LQQIIFRPFRATVVREVHYLVREALCLAVEGPVPYHRPRNFGKK